MSTPGDTTGVRYPPGMTKRRRGVTRGTVHDEPVPFDPVQNVRSLGNFELGNGVQHGLAALVVGLIAALIIVPLSRLFPRRRD